MNWITENSKANLNYVSTSSEIKFLFPQHLRDYWWSKNIGEIQCVIDKQLANNGPSNILFDFTKCRWIDPLPAMSFATEAIRAKYLGHEVGLFFDNPDIGNQDFESGPYINSPNRLLRFLAESGFFSGIEDASNVNLVSAIKCKEDCDQIPTEASYQDSHIVPMKFVALNKLQGQKLNISKEVSRSLSIVKNKLTSSISKRAMDNLVHKLRVALQELLQNVFEHAYDNTSQFLIVSYYVRYRHGLLNLTEFMSDNYSQCLAREKEECPLVDNNWLASKMGCLEVFVLDRGMGMVESYSRGGSNVREKKWPLSEVMKRAYLQGRRKEKDKHKNTEFGGLHLLHSLMVKAGDFVRCYEDNLWCGGHVPLSREAKKIRELIACQFAMKGHAVHLRLGWNSDTDTSAKWAEFDSDERAMIWKDLAQDVTSDHKYFEWFKKHLVIDGDLSQLEVDSSKDLDWVMWRVEPHLMKNDILSSLSRIASLIQQKDGEWKTVLVIADIPSCEAETYAAAIENFNTRLENDWPNQFLAIICATNRMRFAVSEYFSNENCHGFTAFSKILKGSITARCRLPVERGMTIRRLLLKWLKWYDSCRFWSEIGFLSDDLLLHDERIDERLYINSIIDWGSRGDGSKNLIFGYLDFSSTAHNDVCHSIYIRVLTRFAGIMSFKEYRWQPIDKLTESVLRDIYAAEEFDECYELNGKQVLSIGSVLVTGETLNRNLAMNLYIHFFIHNNSTRRGEVSSLLYWFPCSNVAENSVARYSRIGQTPAIAPAGWKSFEVPRFDANGKCIGARTPKQTYADLQSLSPIITKVGHWCYEGHHDIVTVNLHAAVEHSFSAMRSLALFIATRIFSFLGVQEHDIIKSWRVKYAQILSNDNLRVERNKIPGLVVYRSHPCTSSIFRELFGILTDEARHKIEQHVFPVLPIRMHWGGTTFLFPPLVRSAIQNKLHADDQVREIMIFDDAVITGRTMNNFKAALYAIGAKHIKTVVILNRMREPADDTNLNNFEYYWRTDLPTIGKGETCSLCESLRLIKSFRAALTSKSAIDRLEEWQKYWRPHSTIDGWSFGLQPFALSRPDFNKEYCYRHTPVAKSGPRGYLTNIDVTHSTGRLIHVTEIYSMTGRDDYCLKKIHEQEEIESRIEIAASQILLFGAEFSQCIRVNILLSLFRDLMKLPSDDSPYASLAALTIVNGLLNLDTETSSVFLEEFIKTDWSTTSLLSANILLAFVINNFREKFIDNAVYDHMYSGYRLLRADTWPLALRLNSLYRSLLSKTGNAHSEPIPVLRDALKEHGATDQGLIQGALDSVYHISSIIKELPSGLARKDTRKKYENLVDKYFSTSDFVKNSINTLLEKKQSHCLVEVDKSLFLTLEKYLTDTREVIECFFHVIPRVKDSSGCISFVDEIDKLKKTIIWSSVNKNDDDCNCNRNVIVDCNSEINYSKKIEEIWIPWNRELVYVVKDLMINASHVSREIPVPWNNPTFSDNYAHMWIKLLFANDYVSIVFANYCDKPKIKLLESIKSNIQRLQSLISIGGRLELAEHFPPNIFAVKLTIPFAGKLYTGEKQ